ncbi:hypothetical protein CISIN_1g046836mg, partial [Citrus sinensis]
LSQCSTAAVPCLRRWPESSSIRNAQSFSNSQSYFSTTIQWRTQSPTISSCFTLFREWETSFLVFMKCCMRRGSKLSAPSFGNLGTKQNVSAPYALGFRNFIHSTVGGMMKWEGVPGPWTLLGE